VLSELPADRICARDDGRRTWHVQEQAEFTDDRPCPSGRHGLAILGPVPGAGGLDDVHGPLDEQVERCVVVSLAEQRLALLQVDRPETGAQIVDRTVVQVGEAWKRSRICRINVHAPHTPRRTVALATRPKPTT
jgi:hypothetical protein